MKRLTYFFSILFFLLLWTQTYGQNGKYDITAYGALKNSYKFSNKAIEAAIHACTAAGGGDVVIPEGIFISGIIHVKSNVNLYLQNGAVFCGSTNLKDYEVNVPEKSYPQVNKGLLFTVDAENVSSPGQGELDGNGDAFFKTTIAKRLDSVRIQYTRQKYNFRHVDSGLDDVPIQTNDQPYQMIVFSRCKRVTVKDVFIIISPSRCVHLVDCDAVHNYGIRLWTNIELLSSFSIT